MKKLLDSGWTSAFFVYIRTLSTALFDSFITFVQSSINRFVWQEMLSPICVQSVIQTDESNLSRIYQRGDIELPLLQVL